MAGETIGQADLAALLHLASAAATGNVAAASTTTVINLQGVNLGNIDLTGGWVLFDAGALGTGFPPTFANIASNTATSITLSSALLSAPSKGPDLWLFAKNVLNVNVSQNIAEVDGASAAYSSLLSPNTDLSAPTAVTVGTGPVRIDQGTANRRYVLVVNNGSATVYVGKDNTVTTANGIPVAAGASLSLNLGPSLQLWGISGTAGQDVRVIEAA